MKKLLLTVFLCLGFIICYVGGMQRSISDNVTRLHILANSDSAYDQSVKLAVRDNVLNDIDVDKENIEIWLPLIEECVNKYLYDNNIGYTASAEYKKVNFPTKVYENIVLPSGRYNSLQIILGEGKGKNWWCVCFPPLCFSNGSVGYTASEGEEYLKRNLSEDEYKLISKDKKLMYKFKLIELINKS